MPYRGHVRNGVVVLDEPADIEEGSVVSVAVLGEQEPVGDDNTGPTLAERLARVIGKAKGLPPDASLNHDHYLYGLPKK